jgi:hypothetical protein
MARYTPPSIDSFGGISPYLEATRKDHNGYGANDLSKNWRWGVGKHMNITALAVLFGVSWPTMDGWLDRLHIEAGKPRPDKKVANTSDIADNKQ